MVRDAAREVEGLGYRALWTGEAIGREVLTAAQLLLAATDSLVVATGIANIWARDALAMAAGQLALQRRTPTASCWASGCRTSHCSTSGARTTASR